MTKTEFMEQTKRLCDLYGKSLNEEQIEFWFECLKDFEIAKYKRSVGIYARKNKYMPTIADILGVIRDVKLDDWIEEQPREKVECKACKGSGFVWYKKTFSGVTYDYVCQCNCPNAKGLDYDGTKVRDPLGRSQYYLPKAVDIFHVTPDFNPLENMGQERM